MIALGPGVRDIVYGEDGTAVVMVEQEVFAISPLAAEILATVSKASELDLDALVEAAEAAFGPPPPGQDAGAAVAACVDELIRPGVLAHVSSA
ncbi:hypothetical protein QWY28_16235 [Nocardioides sp. SOB77]|uniref:PqqD family protein n=1 Tax=Nocardioides oceani TaxID=3058369 RepID=A0ABT8FJ79_9ACTN|nr:hypothetical protein [Nocardioides oceani]MDN4174510.1 hypothetical protein [Nocardioides oceani]